MVVLNGKKTLLFVSGSISMAYVLALIVYFTCSLEHKALTVLGNAFSCLLCPKQNKRHSKYFWNTGSTILDKMDICASIGEQKNLQFLAYICLMLLMF